MLDTHRTVTFSSDHSFQPGDTIVLKQGENRWWVKLWYKLTLRPVPLRGRVHRITAVSQSSFLFTPQSQ